MAFATILVKVTITAAIFKAIVNVDLLSCSPLNPSKNPIKDPIVKVMSPNKISNRYIVASIVSSI